MDYIILNGKSSKLIGGLMIQTLPPVTKPQMRTEVEEIDGRDGDIVTKLGYSAYEKEIQIGLYGNYEVDEVISYFDSEGTVIFSNELDKYYKYQIFEQIDFEKLIRFKTATVTMHVQPFKYSAVDKPVVMSEMFSIPNQTVSEGSATVTVSNGRINVSGTVTEGTEILVPINELYCRVGYHVITTKSSGTNASAVGVRIVTDDTENAQVLNNGLIILNGGTQKNTGILEAPAYFHYLWIHLDPNVAVNVNLTVSVLALQSIVYNMGNTVSKPKLTLYGSGNIGVYVNGTQVFTIIKLTSGAIIIDSETMEAYWGSSLLNRNVSGDYSKLVLKSGMNIISWQGNVTKAIIDGYSRWI